MKDIKQFGLVFFVCCVAAFGAAGSWGDIIKWVDEDGDIHYGDRVPEKYKESAEVLHKDEVSVVGQEGDIKQQNKQYSSSLKQQDYEERQRKIRAQREAESNQTVSSGLTKEDCRNRFPNNVKMRTQCFLDVADQNDGEWSDTENVAGKAL